MALRIRLRRMGRKKAPHYRIVIAERTMPRDGRFVDSIGHYNPRTEPMTIEVDGEKAKYWMEKGAEPTDTVRSLLRRTGVIGNMQIKVEEPTAEAPAAEAPAAEAPAAEAPAAEAPAEAETPAEEEKPAQEAQPAAEAPAAEETEEKSSGEPAAS